MFFFPAVVASLEKTCTELLVDLRQKLVGLDAETADLSNLSISARFSSSVIAIGLLLFQM